MSALSVLPTAPLRHSLIFPGLLLSLFKDSCYERRPAASILSFQSLRHSQSKSKSTFLVIPIFINPFLLQTTETVVPDHNHLNKDIERISASSSVLRPDPFMFRDGLKTDDELAQLRLRRKTGKRLERYHRHQNNVSISCPTMLHSIKANH